MLYIEHNAKVSRRDSAVGWSELVIFLIGVDHVSYNNYYNYYARKTEQGHKAGRSPWEIIGIRKIAKFFSRVTRRRNSKKIIEQEIKEISKR